MTLKDVLPVPLFVHYGLTLILLTISTILAIQVGGVNRQLEKMKEQSAKESEATRLWREAYTQVLGELGTQPLTRPRLPQSTIPE